MLKRLLFTFMTIILANSQEKLSKLLSSLTFEEKKMVGPMIINPQHLYFTKTSDAYLVTHTPGFMAKICAHGHLSSLKYQTG